VAPLLKVLKDTVEELAVAVDGRVLVALTRGLWELSAKEIFDYLEGLQESFDTKVRQLPFISQSFFVSHNQSHKVFTVHNTLPRLPGGPPGVLRL